LKLTVKSLKEEVADYQKICNSWTRSTKIVFNCIEKQIPHQIKAVVEGDFKTAALLSNFLFGSISNQDVGLSHENNADEYLSNDEFDEIIEKELK